MDKITEGNKLIHEFMGNQRSEKDWGEVTYLTENKGELVWASKLKYHCSLDWLKPVIHKFLELDTNEFIDDLGKLKCIRDYQLRLMTLPIYRSYIDFWYELINAIEWYNKNKK